MIEFFSCKSIFKYHFNNMSNIIDINQDQFLEKVVEKSKNIPVLVDFGHHGVDPANN